MEYAGNYPHGGKGNKLTDDLFCGRAFIGKNKNFIDNLTKDDLKKLNDLDKKYLTAGHITSEKAEKIKEKSDKPLTFKQAEKLAKKSLKKEVFNQSVYDNLGLIYSTCSKIIFLTSGLLYCAAINALSELLPPIPL